MNDNRCENRLSLPGRILLSCLLAVTLTGCSCPLPKNKAQTPSTTSYEPRVYIHPASADLSQASIAVLPFQVPANIEKVRGEEVAALFQQTLLRQQAFHKVKLMPDHYGTLKEAMEIGRDEKLDLVLTGKINYLISGSSLGGGRLNLSLRVIDLTSFDTVWYIEQTVDQAMGYPDNSLFHRLGRIFSTPPIPEEDPALTIPVMLTRISRDISRIIKSGHYPSPYSGSL
ncbi:MAG: hypothetical protein R6V20_07025 [Desulfobia sp.]